MNEMTYLPADAMVMLTWNSRIFLMPRLPDDPPTVRVPDWEGIRRQHMAAAIYKAELGAMPPPPPRNFVRVSFSRGGDCPFYLEVK